MWLVGMMGAGKSSVGLGLAKRLACSFVDTDVEVEGEAGASVAAIFEREGEACFRARERRAIEAVAGQPAVVALGGGAVAQPGARELLENSGTLVYLRARPETLAGRLGAASDRPLLEGLEGAERLDRLRALLEQREVHYGRAAIIVDTDEVGIDEVVAQVVRRLADEDT